MINIKIFDPRLIKIDKKSYKNIGIYHIGYITMNDSDHGTINSVNQFYLVIGEVDGYIEQNNENKYLTFASANKNQKLLKNYTEPWEKIKYHIRTINVDKSGEYEKDYMKIEFDSDDDLPSNKIPKLHNLKIIVRYVFEKDGKYYPLDFFDDCLYEV